MTAVRKVRVQAYCGYKAPERPVCFWLGEKPISVKRILGSWYEEGTEVGGGRRSCFEVESKDGKTYRLCYHQAEDAWFLMETW